MLLTVSLAVAGSLAASVSPHASTAALTPVASLVCLAQTFYIPSSSNMSVAVRNPRISVIAGVYGKYHCALLSSISPRS